MSFLSKDLLFFYIDCLNHSTIHLNLLLYLTNEHIINLSDYELKMYFRSLNIGLSVDLVLLHFNSFMYSI